MMEIEIRAKAYEGIKNKLVDIGAEKKDEYNETDEYFRFEKDDQRRLVIRLRRRDDKNLLTFKGSSRLKEDIAWQEWESEIKDSDSLKSLMLANGLVIVTTIKKFRTSYTFEDFEINIDNIKSLGNFVEVELISDNAEEAHQKIIEFMRKELSIGESDVVKKGYVQLMLEKE